MYSDYLSPKELIHHHHHHHHHQSVYHPFSTHNFCKDAEHKHEHVLDGSPHNCESVGFGVSMYRGIVDLGIG